MRRISENQGIRMKDIRRTGYQEKIDNVVLPKAIVAVAAGGRRSGEQLNSGAGEQERNSIRAEGSNSKFLVLTDWGNFVR